MNRQLMFLVIVFASLLPIESFSQSTGSTVAQPPLSPKARLLNEDDDLQACLVNASEEARKCIDDQHQPPLACKAQETEQETTCYKKYEGATPARLKKRR